MIEYTVRKGDTLSQIALGFLGDAGRWVEIWRDNAEAIVAKQPRGAQAIKYGSPHWIFPGTVLRIKDDKMSKPSEELIAQAEALLKRRYVVHADERQKKLGVSYIEAETRDFARFMAQFALDHYARVIRARHKRET